MTIDKTGKRKRVRLRNLRLTELSLVDHPANPHANIMLAKRGDNRSSEMAFDKLNRPASFETFDDAVAEIRRREGLTGTAAMRKARERHPDLLAKMQADEPSSRPTVETRDIGKAVRDFSELVDQIAADRKVTKSVAMSIARQENPAAFQAAYHREEH